MSYGSCASFKCFRNAVNIYCAIFPRYPQEVAAFTTLVILIRATVYPYKLVVQYFEVVLRLDCLSGKDNNTYMGLSHNIEVDLNLAHSINLQVVEMLLKS